jgi:hypothetical protein
MAFLSVWERVRTVTSLKKLKDLADFIGVSGQFVSKKKKEDHFPVEWAFKIAQEYGTSTDWLMTGTEGTTPKNDRTAELEFDILKDLDIWLKELVVGEPYRKEWFRASIEDSFPMFREWKKRREKEESRSDIDPQSNVA